MNFLCHGYRFLDRPYIVAGTAIPDWLSVVDRRIRAKSKHAKPWLESEHLIEREIAQGIVQHHHDDQWFHGSRLVSEMMLRFAVELREQLPGDEGFRPSFVGHVLVEMLLDAALIRRNPSLAERYYAALDAVSPIAIQDVLNRMTQHPTTGLAPVISRFAEARFLYDYLDEGKLLMRVNQVMMRVGLPTLADSLLPWLSQARATIEFHCDDLLTESNPLPKNDPQKSSS